MKLKNKQKSEKKNQKNNPPVEGEHNQHIASDAQCPDDEDEHCDNVVSMVGHIHLAYEAALGVCFLWLHALSGPHGSDTSSALPPQRDTPVCNPLCFAAAGSPL